MLGPSPPLSSPLLPFSLLTGLMLPLQQFWLSPEMAASCTRQCSQAIFGQNGGSPPDKWLVEWCRGTLSPWHRYSLSRTTVRPLGCALPAKTQRMFAWQPGTGRREGCGWHRERCNWKRWVIFCLCAILSWHDSINRTTSIGHLTIMWLAVEQSIVSAGRGILSRVFDPCSDTGADLESRGPCDHCLLM